MLDSRMLDSRSPRRASPLASTCQLLLLSPGRTLSEMHSWEVGWNTLVWKEIWLEQTITVLCSDKRSSAGNLCYFTDQFDNHPWDNPELSTTLRNTVRFHFWEINCNSTQARRRQTSGQTSEVDKDKEEEKDPATTLQAMAGEVCIIYVNLPRQFYYIGAYITI